QQRFSKKHYEFEAIMVIEHDGGQYTKLFDHMDEFENWLPRFLDKGCKVVKTEYDLAPAFYESEQKDMNLSSIPVEAWKNNTSYTPIERKVEKIHMFHGRNNHLHQIEK